MLYTEGYRRLRDSVKSGGLGRVYYAFSERTGVGPLREDVDAVWDRAAHDVDIFNRLFGRPLWVSAVGVDALDNGLVDAAFLSLRYENRVTCHAHVSWMNQKKVSRVSVVGERGRVDFDDSGAIKRVLAYGGGVAQKPPHRAERSDLAVTVTGGDEPLRAEAEHFVWCVGTRARPRSDGRSGADVVAVLEAASKSIILGAPTKVKL